MTEEEFYEFTTYYYKAGSPQRAAKVLEYFISEKLQANPEEPTAYFFARIAQMHPEVLRDYEGLFEKSPHHGRVLILRILELAGDQKVRDFLTARLQDKKFPSEKSVIARVLQSAVPAQIDVLQRPIRDGTDLDYLWGEFIVTGDTRAVVRIIDVLERPDRVREKLEAWLQPRPIGDLLPWSEGQRRRVRENLLRTGNILCDLQQKKVETLEDLDTLCLLYELEWAKDRFQEIRQILPFSLSNEDLTHMATKAAAKWSLGSNARQHPLVLHTCEAQLASRTTRAKLALLEIVAGAYLARGDYATAERRIREYLELNPEHRELKGKLQDALAEINFPFLMSLSTSTAQRQGIDVPQARDVALRCAQVTEDTRTYHTQLVLRDRSQENFKSRDYVAIEWKLQFVAPDRYHVTQAAWEIDFPDGLFDEWISIGGEYYNNVVMWEKQAKPDEDREALNHRLRANSYFTMLRSEEPSSAGIYRYKEHTYYLLEYRTRGLSWLQIMGEASKDPCPARVWIDSSTGYLVKAEVAACGKGADGKPLRLELEQVFTSYNGDTQVEAPRAVVLQQ